MPLNTQRKLPGEQDYSVQCYIKPTIYNRFKQLLTDNGIISYGAGSKVKQINSDLLSDAIDFLLKQSNKKSSEFLSKYKEKADAEA